HRRDLVDWLESGAYFYVCGDAKAMAKDVRNTLANAYADVKSLAPEVAEQAIRTLERERRYLQDVYWCPTNFPATNTSRRPAITCAARLPTGCARRSPAPSSRTTRSW